MQKFEAYTKTLRVGDTHSFPVTKNLAIFYNQYLAKLYTLSKSCELQDLKDSLIRDRIICGIAGDGLRDRLL